MVPEYNALLRLANSRESFVFMADIVLATFNARYRHAALGLRCLLANLGPLAPRAALLEFSLEHTPLEAAEAILAHGPVVVGLGVYIWNGALITSLVRLLKQVRPQVRVVLGGPEISWESESHAAFSEADYIVTGEGEEAFRHLCVLLLAGRPPVSAILPGGVPDLAALKLPYDLYSAEDLAHREIYVESSRGCPYRCSFCLSSLEGRMRRFDLDDFLAAMAGLMARGARRFKFVDRSFNLDVRRACAILEFFLERLDEGLFLHLEIAPEKIAPSLRAVLCRFPAGTLQMELGVQSLDERVRQGLNRVGDPRRVEENIRWLLIATHAHLHTDLIIGLPGEDLAGFARGFDRLCRLGVHEIQVGILKRLPGAPLGQSDHGGVFNPDPPYNLLYNRHLDFALMRRLERFARYWEMVVNSGRFPHSRALLGEFSTFLALSDWLHQRVGRTHGVALERLAQLLAEGLPAIGLDGAAALEQDRQWRERLKKGKSPLPARQQRHQREAAP